MEVKTIVSKAVLQAKAHAPEILLVVGLTAGGFALYNSFKLGQKIERKGTVRKAREQLQALRENPSENNKGIRNKIIMHTASELAKDSLPAVTSAVISAACIAASFKVLNGRYVATAAALTSVTEAFAKYRETVGQGVLPMYPGAVLDEDGKGATITREANEKMEKDLLEAGVEPKKLNAMGTGFGFMWDKFSCHFRAHDPTSNAFHIQQVQNHANMLLIGRGHVFLNEIHDLFDVPRTPEGSLVGWVRDAAHPDTTIQLFPIRTVSGSSPNEIKIESNVMGVIYRMI